MTSSTPRLIADRRAIAARLDEIEVEVDRLYEAKAKGWKFEQAPVAWCWNCMVDMTATRCPVGGWRCDECRHAVVYVAPAVTVTGNKPDYETRRRLFGGLFGA